MKTTNTSLDQALDALLAEPIEEHFEPRDEFTQYRLTRQIVDQANAPQQDVPHATPTQQKAPIMLWMVAAASLLCSASALMVSLNRPNEQVTPPTQPVFAPAAQTPQVTQPPTVVQPTTTHKQAWRISQTHPSLGLRPGEHIGPNQSIQTNHTPITAHARAGHVLTLLPKSQANLATKANTLSQGVVMVRATGQDAMRWRLDAKTTLKAQNATFALTQQGKKWHVDILQGSVHLTHQGQHITHYHGRLTHAQPHHARTVPRTTMRRMRLWQRQHQLLGNANHTHGTLELSSKPGTRVLINQVDMGVVPMAMTVEPGLYDVTFVDVGKKTHKQHVRVAPNKHQRLSYHWPETPQKTTSAPKATPVVTLAQAQSYDMAKQWRKAAEAYEQVLQRPHTPSLKIHVGWLYVRQLGTPKSALRHFDGYLTSAPNGPLAQEALKGKATAFRAMQAPQQEARVLKQLLKRYPNTVGAAKHKKRLNEIYKGLIKR